MSVTSVLALLAEIVANLPVAVTTGEQLIRLVNASYEELSKTFGEEDPTPAQINVLVAKITANSAVIQAIE